LNSASTNRCITHSSVVSLTPSGLIESKMTLALGSLTSGPFPAVFEQTLNYEQPLVVPQLPHTKHDPARCIVLPHW
jgi:hypothetical protein